jgi:hypothetical protein
MSKKKKLTKEQQIDEKRKKVIAYHKKNPHLYDAFVILTAKVYNKGYTHYSAEGIIHAIRWESYIKANDEKYKICNDVKAFYSRLLMHTKPKYKNFFKLRPSIWDGFNFDEL